MPAPLFHLPDVEDGRALTAPRDAPVPDARPGPVGETLSTPTRATLVTLVTTATTSPNSSAPSTTSSQRPGPYTRAAGFVPVGPCD